MKGFFPIFLNIVIPLLAGMVYLAMARYVKRIRPMRTLIAGETTYRGAYWGFLIFGIYLASRPLQILQPHPWPLIVNNIREFLMIGIFGPAVFVAMMSLVFGADRMKKKLVMGIFGGCIFLAIVFVITNVFAIGGSEEIYQVGSFHAYDGLWFKNSKTEASGFIQTLFIIRLLDPVILVFVAGTTVLWRAVSYPPEMRSLYNNMPKKLYLLGIACYAFSLSMLSVGLLFIIADIPNQWWIYYIGALAAGVLETISISMPMRKDVQVSEHL